MEEYYSEKKIPYFKIRALFLVAGAYNFGLAVFFFLANPMGAAFSLTHFAMALLVVFAILFCNIAYSPVRYKKLIPYALLRNLAYCSIAGWFYYAGKLPLAWMIPGIVDAVLLLLFAATWVRLFWEDDDI